MEKPVIAEVYNQYMAGVDIMDQKLGTYAFPHKSSKWYFTWAITLSLGKDLANEKNPVFSFATYENNSATTCLKVTLTSRFLIYVNESRQSRRKS